MRRHRRVRLGAVVVRLEVAPDREHEPVEPGEERPCLVGGLGVEQEERNAPTATTGRLNATPM